MFPFWPCPSYNKVSSYIISDTSGAPEPVAIQECKDYMRLEGFSEDQSPSTEFNFDDDLIAELIASARTYIEECANVSLIPHEVEVVLTNDGDGFLPFSPIDEITTVVDSNGDAVDDTLIKVVGNNRKKLKTPTGYDLVVTYTTRALNDSRALIDIKKIVAFLYENRGLSVNDAVNNMNLLIESYSRKSAIA